MKRAQAFVSTVQGQYGAAKIGAIIADRFDFDWSTEAPNFGALMNSVIPDAISWIKTNEAQMLAGSRLGEASIEYPVLSAPSQALLQSHLDDLSSYLVHRS